MMPSKIEESDVGPLSRKARVKQWIKTQWKNGASFGMMPSKIEAPMWDHYRVKHA